MNLRLIAVGKIRERYIAAALDDFRTRLRPYYPLEEMEIKAADGSDPAKAVVAEGERILKLLAPGEPLWLLERSGVQLDSLTLSKRLSELADSGASRLSIVVAGTYGASPELLARADFKWSLSALTFLHEWARALVLEQLYRAAKIARNEPYHH